MERYLSFTITPKLRDGLFPLDEVEFQKEKQDYSETMFEYAQCGAQRELASACFY